MLVIRATIVVKLTLEKFLEDQQYWHDSSPYEFAPASSGHVVEFSSLDSAFRAEKKQAVKPEL